MDDTTTPTSVRLLEAAMRLFAEQGYRATTVGEIEAAAGLSPRAGAFYRHFSGKADVLRAAVDRWVADAAELPDSVGDLLPLDDVRAELTVVARGTLAILRRQAELFAFLRHDAAEFPAVLEEVHDRLVRASYDRVAQYLGTRAPGPRTDEQLAALAAVALGSLVNAQHHRALYGHPVAGADDDALVAAWVEVWEAWIRSGDAAAGLASTPSPRPST